MRLPRIALGLLCFGVCLPSLASGQATFTPASLDSSHGSEEWANIALHLPNPATSTPGVLEVTGDTLRARRYPQDAVRYYSAAVTRGGDPAVLFKKSGIACLEMQQVGLARTYFLQAVHQRKSDAAAWNNLGAAEFILHNIGAAIRDYRHAVKLDGRSATFHGNLALAYFEARQGENARRELAKGLALDPDLLHRTGQGGYTAQVIASEHYAEICFEMARLYATQGDLEAVLDWLTKASDRGFNIKPAMEHDAALRPLLADTRVQVLLRNKQSLEAKAKIPSDVPSLGAASP